MMATIVLKRGKVSCTEMQHGSFEDSYSSQLFRKFTDRLLERTLIDVHTQQFIFSSNFTSLGLRMHSVDLCLSGRYLSKQNDGQPTPAPGDVSTTPSCCNSSFSVGGRSCLRVGLLQKRKLEFTAAKIPIPAVDGGFTAW